jgi:hypothetical protein
VKDDGDEPAVRRLVETWMSRPPDTPPGDQGRGAGLGLPPAPAATVIAAACRVAGAGRRGGPPPAPGLRLIAEAMVLDEHPSARGWTRADRHEVLDWITLIIDRFGEDGVRRLTAELSVPVSP